MNWSNWVLENELPIRLSFFIGVFVLMALWEIASPRRQLTISKAKRWTSNIGLVVLNSVVIRLLFPTAAVGVSILAQENDWGLFNQFELPGALEVILCVIALDFVIYLQHVMVHFVPLFWRLHRVHHADLDYDLTTGSRFHTLEIILSMLIKFATIAILGPPLVAVVIFEVLLNATAMFNHGNVYLPVKIDRVLRLFVVTPDMHRVHHSIQPAFTNSNFGFSLPWWDRLFGTYRAQPPQPHTEMQIGLPDYRHPQQVNRLDGMLMIPFKSARS
jgi:sterol desaturase/sphingolipid hydroxylase (fatty acid hydroxylase superfamily)